MPSENPQPRSFETPMNFAIALMKALGCPAVFNEEMRDFNRPGILESWIQAQAWCIDCVAKLKEVNRDFGAALNSIADMDHIGPDDVGGENKAATLAEDVLDKHPKGGGV